MKNKYILPLLIAAVGVYLIWQSQKKKSGEKETLPPPPPSDGGTPPAGGGSPELSPPTTLTGVETYIVNTQTTNLNVRALPSTSSALVGTLLKGAEFKGRPASVSGWLEVVNTFRPTPTIIGYVSSTYVLKKGS